MNDLSWEMRERETFGRNTQSAICESSQYCKCGIEILDIPVMLLGKHIAVYVIMLSTLHHHVKQAKQPSQLRSTIIHTVQCMTSSLQKTARDKLL